MNCPKCYHEESSVLDSRANVTYIRRRRKCDRCCHLWTTNEILAEHAEMLRVSKTGPVLDIDTLVKERARTMVTQILQRL